MEVNNENYFDVSSRMEYMGASQFKRFKKCEAEALAYCKGEIQDEPTQSLLEGSYVDAYFSNELEQFTKKHPEIFTKQGVLKANFNKAVEDIKFIESDENFMKYLNGKHQVVMTGTIAGVKFKIKMDSYHPKKCIVDQKYMKDLKPIWVDGLGWTNFVEAYGYDTQGAIYQEIESQNSEDHKKLPFILAPTTKEKTPKNELLNIDQYDLDKALEEVKQLAPRFDQIKKGLIEPKYCGDCDYCRKRLKVTGIHSYHDYDRKEK